MSCAEFCTHLNNFINYKKKEFIIIMQSIFSFSPALNYIVSTVSLAELHLLPSIPESVYCEPSFFLRFTKCLFPAWLFSRKRGVLQVFLLIRSSLWNSSMWFSLSAGCFSCQWTKLMWFSYSENFLFVRSCWSINLSTQYVS